MSELGPQVFSHGIVTNLGFNQGIETLEVIEADGEIDEVEIPAGTFRDPGYIEDPDAEN